MGERECWVNVYWNGKPGLHHRSLIACKDAGIPSEFERGKPWNPAFRIHVRLKPEGAPRRYASEVDRWLWEAGARSLSRLTAPRTPKTVESASHG